VCSVCLVGHLNIQLHALLLFCYYTIIFVLLRGLVSAVQAVWSINLNHVYILGWISSDQLKQSSPKSPGETGISISTTKMSKRTKSAKKTRQSKRRKRENAGIGAPGPRYRTYFPGSYKTGIWRLPRILTFAELRSSPVQFRTQMKSSLSPMRNMKLPAILVVTIITRKRKPVQSLQSRKANMI